MKVSFEVPKKLLKKSRDFNDFDYFLDIFNCDFVYNFYKESLNLGRIVYLDNSLYERHSRNIDYDFEKFLELSESLKNDNLIIIAPDFYNDAKATIDAVKNFKNLVNGKIMAVVHGKTIDEMLYCFLEFDKILDLGDIIGIPFCDSAFNFITRNQFLKMISPKHKIHILGLKYPDEVKDFDFSKIYSLDTSYPIISTLENSKVFESPTKPKTLMYDVFFKNLKIDSKLLEFNISEFKSYLK